MTTSSEGKWTEDFVNNMVDALLGWTGYKGKEATLCSLARKLMAEKEEVGQGHGLRKMTPEEWQLHVKRDHLPHRKDCQHCIQAASAKPHRRTSHRSAYVLSIDLAGPFRDRGKDMGGSKYKFMLVASYQFTKLPGTVTSPSAKEVEAEIEGGELEADVEDLVRELEQLFEEEGVKSTKKHEVDEGKGESKPVEPEDEKKEEERLRKEVEEASEPFEFNTTYFVRGMTGRKTGEALRALPEIYIDLRALGFPVAQVHCDRAREFRMQVLLNGRRRGTFSSRGLKEGQGPPLSRVGAQWPKPEGGEDLVVVGGRDGRSKATSHGFWPQHSFNGSVWWKSLYQAQALRHQREGPRGEMGARNLLGSGS